MNSFAPIIVLAVFGALSAEPCLGQNPMRQITYERHEYTWPEPERREASLLAFVYDIPYFGACGIFPPLHIANEVFRSGGGQGGMGPGATWDPFEVSNSEFVELVKSVNSVDPASLSGDARYSFQQFAFDHTFDHVADRSTWLKSVCDKHRDAYREKVKLRNRGDGR